MSLRIAGLTLASAAMLAGCAQTNTAVTQGQLYCAEATANGPLVVALANAAGVPVSVIGMAKVDVQSACAVIGAIPVVPPANPAAAPVVAAQVVASK